jgi:hypothetical protein
LEQVTGQLLVLAVTVTALALALAITSPVLSQYTSRNRIREAEAVMVSLYNEIVKVQEEPVGSRRTIELEIKHGGIEVLNGPPRIIYSVEIPRRVRINVTGMDFAFTGDGATFGMNLSLLFDEQTYIGPGTNKVYITKTDAGKINLTTETFL